MRIFTLLLVSSTAFFSILSLAGNQSVLSVPAETFASDSGKIIKNVSKTEFEKLKRGISDSQKEVEIDGERVFNLKIKGFTIEGKNDSQNSVIILPLR